MKENALHEGKDGVMECAFFLSNAKTPSDVEFAWSLLGGHFSELSGIVYLDEYEQQALPRCIKKYVKKPNDYLVPYFISEKLYFVDDDMLKSIYANGETRFPIDYSIMFDTNIASYIDRLIRGEHIGEVQDKFLGLIDELLREDLNFDFSFYLMENIKGVLPKVSFDVNSKLKFWLSLDKDFRRNLCSLYLFASIDCREYKRTLNPKLTISFRQAVRRAINSSYDIYVIKKNVAEELVLTQRRLLLSLIGMIQVQEGSNKKARNKMKQYMHYIHHVIGIYMDREAVIAHKYFLSRNNLPILRKIQKKCNIKGLLKELDNIAWDMLSPRVMEAFIPNTLFSKGAYFIPMFLTFDKKLRSMLNLYPIKGVIYNKQTKDIISLPNISSTDYFEKHGLLKDFEWFLSNDMKSERVNRSPQTLRTIHGSIYREYRKLRKILNVSSKK